VYLPFTNLESRDADGVMQRPSLPKGVAVYKKKTQRNHDPTFKRDARLSQPKTIARQPAAPAPAPTPIQIARPPSPVTSNSDKSQSVSSLTGCTTQVVDIDAIHSKPLSQTTPPVRSRLARSEHPVTILQSKVLFKSSRRPVASDQQVTAKTISLSMILLRLQTAADELSQ
jgi:hypothetical protein